MLCKIGQNVAGTCFYCRLRHKKIKAAVFTNRLLVQVKLLSLLRNDNCTCSNDCKTGNSSYAFNACVRSCLVACCSSCICCSSIVCCCVSCCIVRSGFAETFNCEFDSKRFCRVSICIGFDIRVPDVGKKCADIVIVIRILKRIFVNSCYVAINNYGSLCDRSTRIKRNICVYCEKVEAGSAVKSPVKVIN